MNCSRDQKPNQYDPFFGSDGCLADLMVFLRAQSLFAILHSRLDDILPAECVIIYLRTVFPCKCFPWICLEIPRNILLFFTSLMLLMMYALLIAEKDWWPQIAQCIHLFKHICTYTFIQKDLLPLAEASTAKNICIFITNCRKEYRGYSASNRILILY